MRNTLIVRELNYNEIDHLEKISNVDDIIWQPHLPKSHAHLTALKDGKSIHIQMLDDNLKQIDILSKKNLFPEFYNLLTELCNNHKLGRAYIHKLKPKNCIERHNDNNMLYMKSVEKRMQMYIDIPKGCVLLLDNKLQDTEKFKYKYIDFAWEHDHYYYNGSDKDWVFCVFDILK